MIDKLRDCIPYGNNGKWLCFDRDQQKVKLIAEQDIDIKNISQDILVDLMKHVVKNCDCKE